MVKHVVIWKLVEKSDGEKFKLAIEGLSGKIPGLISIEAGLDFNGSESAGDLILISTHESKEALDAYQNHPDHVAVKNLIVPGVYKRMVVDFTVDE